MNAVTGGHRKVFGRQVCIISTVWQIGRWGAFSAVV